jgi:hypothetical protein
VTSVAVAPNDPRHALASLRDRATLLGESLYGVETEPEFGLLGDPSQFTGETAALAAGAKARIDQLWLRYPAVTEAIDRLEQAVADEDRPTIWRLLGPSAVVLPDGSVAGIAGMLAALEADLAAARNAARRLGDGWRTVVPKVDRLAAEVTRLGSVGDDLGLTPARHPAAARELAAARRLTTGLAARAASDPLGVDIAALESAVGRARAGVEDLAAQRQSLPDDLARAAAQLADLERLIAAGAEALATARAKVKQPDGLLQPLDPADLVRDDRSLRPWLGRIQAAAERDEWHEASTGLNRWRRVADGWKANARAVLDANRAPVRRRNELRGLLDGYRVKAAAAGLAEDPAVSERFQIAHAALAAAPSDLVAAAAGVDEYIGAVNRAISG